MRVDPTNQRSGACGGARHLIARLIILVALVCTASTHAQGDLHRYVGQRIAATVTSIVDGDTVHVVLADGATITIRLDGIDSPERGEPFSDRATRETRVLLTKQVQVRGTDVNRY